MNARLTSFVSYSDLLPHCDVFITNGGFGGVQLALSHGIPLVVAGSTEDKPEVAARVEWAGCGNNLRTGTPTPQALLAAVRTILCDDAYASKSRGIRDAMAGQPDPVDIIHSALLALTVAP